MESVRRNGSTWLDREKTTAHVRGASHRLRADRARVRSRRKDAAEFPDAHTIASGLRVPKAIGDFLMLKILRESNGGAIAVDDEEMIRVAREVGASEGLFICPEGAACFAALKMLRLAGKNRVR